MGATLDLSKAHSHRVHGDLAAIFTWVNNERSLVLVPHRRPGAPWYIVGESASWKYNDPSYLARQCKVACDVLGLEPSMPNWVRIASIINEALPDLIRMPSAPDPELLKGNYGHRELREAGKVILSDDIKLEAETGATYG